MANIVSPWLRSPFTDLTANLVNHQFYGECADMELKLVECMEAYGLQRGLEKCDALLKDFRECANWDKQDRRAFAMRWERNRQLKAGERTKENMYAPAPKLDSF